LENKNVVYCILIVPEPQAFCQEVKTLDTFFRPKIAIKIVYFFLCICQESCDIKSGPEYLSQASKYTKHIWFNTPLKKAKSL